MLLNMSRAKLRGIVAFWHEGTPYRGTTWLDLSWGSCCGSGSLFSTLQPFHINITIVRVRVELNRGAQWTRYNKKLSQRRVATGNLQAARVALLGACGMSLLRRCIAGKLQVGAFNFVPGYERGQRHRQPDRALWLSTNECCTGAAAKRFLHAAYRLQSEYIEWRDLQLKSGLKIYML